MGLKSQKKSKVYEGLIENDTDRFLIEYDLLVLTFYQNILQCLIGLK